VIGCEGRKGVGAVGDISFTSKLCLVETETKFGIHFRRFSEGEG
jgi:hypothetical protein